MRATLESLGIDLLPIQQKIALAHELLDSIAAESHRSFLTDEQRAELRHRVVEDDADPDGGTPWEEIKRDALARFQK